jgi:hypothetical protein
VGEGFRQRAAIVSHLTIFVESEYASWIESLNLAQPGCAAPDKEDDQARMIKDAGISHEKHVLEYDSQFIMPVQISIGHSHQFGNTNSLWTLSSDHEVLVAPDLNLTVLEHGIVAHSCVEADIVTVRYVLVTYIGSGAVSCELVESRNRYQLIAIQPVDPADHLIAGAAHSPAQQKVMLSPDQGIPSVGAQSVDKRSILAGQNVFEPYCMKTGVGHQPGAWAAFQPGMQLKLLPIPSRQRSVDRDPLPGVVAWADQQAVLTAPAVRHVVVAQETSGIRSVQPFFHPLCGVGGISHASLEIIEEVTHQQQMVVWLPHDNMVRYLNLVVYIREDQATHFDSVS